MYPSRLYDRIYTVAILAGGLGLLTWTSFDFVRDHLSLPPLTQALSWFLLLSLGALAPLPLPRRRAWISFSPLLELAALIIFGFHVATALMVLSRLATNLRKPWNSTFALALGSGVLALVTAGFVHQILGGKYGDAFVDWQSQLLPLLAAGVSLLVVRRGITWLGRCIQNPTQSRQPRFAASTHLSEFFLLLFAAPVALVQLRIGLEGMVLCLLPLLLARHMGEIWNRGQRAHLEAVRNLMSAVDATDPFTRGHSYRISKMCLRVGQHLGLTDWDLLELEYSALLHDIGRTAIQHDILVKPHELNNQEQSMLRTHPRIGGEILDRIGFFPPAASAVRAHHEQPDGKGYPAKLVGESIPVASRIIMAVAAFDAMTSDRPYRRGLSPEAAFVELRSKVGSQFFGNVVEALHDLYASGSLFDEFEPEILKQYASGEENSRAVEEHLQEAGALVEKPAGHASSRTPQQDDVPILEMPPVSRSDVIRREFLLSADGTQKLSAAVLSDVGCVRENNEDASGMFHGEYGTCSCLLVVADGMGGAAAGEVASKLAVETVRDVFFGDEGYKNPGKTLRESIQLANEVVCSRAAEDARWAGMGTTCVAAAIVGDQLTIGHVGDSRAYLVTKGKIRRLTMDHSLAEELALAGAIAGENAKHVLTRSIGQEKAVDVDLTEAIPLEPGNALVICSDGLSNQVEDDEIRATVEEYRADVACTKLVELARERGGPDNITVQVARAEFA